MKSRKVALLAVLAIIGCAVLAVGFSLRENIAPLKKKALDTPNPTAYVFQMPVESVREKVIDAFSIEQQIRNRSVFAFRNKVGTFSTREIILKPETRDTALFGKAIFEREENRKAIFLHAFGDPILSRTYFALGRPLGYRATFHVHLEPEASGTRVSIEVVNPTVVKGIGGFGPHGFYSNDVPVSPTTVEEYELLRYIGFAIGEINMPSISYPK